MMFVNINNNPEMNLGYLYHKLNKGEFKLNSDIESKSKKLDEKFSQNVNDYKKIY